MGKKSIPKAPAAPDYAAAATAQGNANLDAARTGAELTNTNQYTPYGSQVFTKSPDSDQWSSTISLSPEQQHLLDLQNQGDAALGEAAIGQLGRVKDSFSQGLDLSNAPDRVNSVSGPNYSMYDGTPAQMQTLGNAAPMQRVGSAAQMQTVGAGPDYQNLGAGPDYQNLGAGPAYGKYTGDISQLPDYGAQAQQVGDALYKQATSRLDPQFQQAESAERQRLLNTGVAEDSEMYRNAMDTFARGRNDAYSTASNNATMLRGQELSRMNNDFYTGNAQKFGQEMQKLGYNNDVDARSFADQQTAAGFNNANAARSFGDQQTAAGYNNANATQKYANAITGAGFNNAANSQDYNNTLAGANFNNAAASQDFGNAATSAGFNNVANNQNLDNALRTTGFNNAAQGQQFSDAVTAGNFQNAQRGAAIDEAAYMRNDPLNMYNALSTGAQVTNPTFRGTGQVATPNAAPTFAATQAADQRAIDLYNSQLASSGSAQGGLFGMLGNLGGAAIQRWGGGR